MQRLIPALVLAALLAGAIVLWPRGTVAPPLRGPGDVYLALGDSLATGAMLSDPRSESYVALLAARLAPKGVERHVNLGVAGATSSSLLRGQLPQALALIERSRNEGLRVSPITVGIGGNDLRSVERAGTSEREQLLRQVDANLDAVLGSLRTAAPDADIAVMTYYDPFNGDPLVANSDAEWIQRLNNVIRRQAQNHGVAVAEVYAAFTGGRAYEYTNTLLGDVHANRRGHVAIADAFLQALYPE